MINLNFPLNIVSFGAVAQAILREFYKRDIRINLFPIGPIDLSSYSIDQSFGNYLQNAIQRAPAKFKENDSSLKLWHLNGSQENIGLNHNLYTFHETDSISETELNLINNQKRVLVSSQFTKKTFEDFGSENIVYCPLGIDTHHFYEKSDTQYLENDVITWCIIGKLEERKQTLRTIKIWSELYGNNRKHQLIVLAFNPFLPPQQQEQVISQTLGKPFFNIVFLPQLKTSAEVNDTLNACDIFLSFSRLEGFNIPLITALSLGKTCVALNEHVHKDYLTAENSILIESTGKLPAIDNVFFHQNSPFNSGNWFECINEAIAEGMQKAEKSIEIINNKKRSIYYNEARKIVNDFNYSKTLDIILDNFK